MPEAWYGLCLQWHSPATQYLAHPQNTRSLAQPVPVMARPCLTSTHYLPNFFPSSSLILHYQHLSSLNTIFKTSITTNHQTFISPSNLHQTTKFFHPNNSKHHSKHNSPIKNNFHPPKIKFIQIPRCH